MDVQERRQSYRWVILGLALLTVATAYGVRNSFGVLLLPLQAEFGWSQSATVGAYTLHWLAFGLSAPFFGGLADRLRPRLMMPIAALALALALALATQVRELWHFYAMYGLVLGAGVSALGMPPHAAIVARWFTTQRGTAYAVLNGGVSLSLLLAGLAQWLTLHYGWRAALVGIGVLLALIVAPLTALLHRGARPEPARPAAGAAAAGSGSTARGGPAVRERIGAPEQPAAARTLRRVLRSRPFWLVFATYVLYTAQQHILIVYQLPYLVTRGYDPLLAASVLSGTGLANMLGLASSGPPSERLGREVVVGAGVALVLVGVGALFLAGQGVSAVLPVYALAYGCGLGLISPQLSASAADLFAGPRFGTIYGSFNLAAGLGGALAPWLVGRLVEATGQHDLALATVALLILGPGMLIWLAAPRRYRQAPSAMG